MELGSFVLVGKAGIRVGECTLVYPSSVLRMMQCRQKRMAAPG